MRAKVGTTMLRDDRPRVLAAATKRGVDSPSEDELMRLADSLTKQDNAAKMESTMLRDDMARVLATATKRGVDSTSEAERLQIAGSLTKQDNEANVGSTMLRDDMARVLAAATKRGVDVDDGNAVGQVAKYLQRVENRWGGQWDGKLMEIAKYKKDHGHLPRIKDSPQLGKWLETQRGLKRKLDKGEHAKGMTSERASKLTAALGYVWNP
jgi:hypothetical protein